MQPETLYIKLGFWDTVRSSKLAAAGACNRRIECMTRELGGIKSLYSDAYYTEDEFWALYNGREYAALKQRYDPYARFPDLYEKCVLNR